MSYANLLLNVLYHIVMEMKIRESCLQSGTFIYKPGISVTKQDFHLQMGSLGLQMGFSGYYLPRIQYKQISLYIQLLEDNGTRLNENITKHLDDDIWELRPGNNRVLYFYFKNDTFVLLHQFRKKTKKTPKREIERAKAERDDYLARKEAE